jgi:S1-C subfamily serine protease
VNLEEAIEHIRPSVWPVSVQHRAGAPNGTPFRMGTAFAVSAEGYLVTALHAIDLMEDMVRTYGSSPFAYFGLADRGGQVARSHDGAEAVDLGRFGQRNWK